MAELLVDPAGQNRSYDCRDDNGSGDLGVRGGCKLGVARRDLGESNRRGHSRAGDGGASHGSLAVTTAQALERKGDGTDDKQRDKAQQDTGNTAGDKARQAHGRTELKSDDGNRGIGTGNQQVLDKREQVAQNHADNERQNGADDGTDRDVGETRDTEDDHGDGGAGRKEQDTDGALLGLIAELAHDARIERHVAKRNAADDRHGAQTQEVIVKEICHAQAESRCDDQLGNQHDDAGLDGARRGLEADAGAHKQQDRGDDGIGATAAGSRKEAADLKNLRAEGVEQKTDDHRIDHDVARNARNLEFLLLVGGCFLCHETPFPLTGYKSPRHALLQ